MNNMKRLIRKARLGTIINDISIFVNATSDEVSVIEQEGGPIIGSINSQTGNVYAWSSKLSHNHVLVELDMDQNEHLNFYTYGSNSILIDMYNTSKLYENTNKFKETIQKCIGNLEALGFSTSTRIEFEDLNDPSGQFNDIKTLGDALN